MDYLDKLIQLAQIQGEINIRCLFQGDWQIQHSEVYETQGLFHLIEQGSCWLSIGNQRFELEAGDLFFLPQHQQHALGTQHTELSSVKTAKAGHFTVHQIGQSSPDFKMFCGRFYYQKEALLISALPDYLHIRLRDTPIFPLIELFLQEANHANMGSKSVIDALSNILFIYILRYVAGQGELNQGILFALKNKRLNQALMAILQTPESAWRVEELAELSNMSRANFCRVFQQQLGLPPAKFLTKIRLQQAAYLLMSTQKSVLEIALAVGYQTEAHFSKAFKSAYQLSPSQYRK